MPWRRRTTAGTGPDRRAGEVEDDAVVAGKGVDAAGDPVTDTSGRVTGSPPAGSRPRRVVRPPRRWPWILGLALVLTALVGGAVTVWWTPVFGLRSVQVVGADQPVQDEVRAAVAVPEGTPLARIDLDALTARLAQVPTVASVEVSRGWPHALDVRVVPRTPVAVTQANGRWWLMDATGNPYLSVDAAPAGLPVVELATPGSSDPATAAALTVTQALPPDLRSTVAAVAARSAFDVTLRLTDGRTVIWGDATDAAQTARKIQVLPALLEQQGSTYDVSDPTLVTVR